MKQIWESELSGKQFKTEQECIDYENKIKRLELEKQEKDKLETESLKNIEKLYDDYVKAVEEHRKTFGKPFLYSYVFEPFDFFFGRQHRNGWRNW